jgi:wobble nucleotide-excising tRNase
MRECAALKCALPVEFQTRGQVGETLRYLEVEGGHKPNEILSEGEQKAVALADFLTELGLNPDAASIVLDDPVTSLDHHRKQLIAKRLVQEASKRQVIIFTHDLVFLSLMIDEAEEANVDTVTHWVEKDAREAPGNVRLNDSPATSKEYRKTDRAKASLQVARNSAGNERVSAIRRGMGELRRTVEETVQFHLFKEVVARWRENIMVTKVKQISWDNALADEIDGVFAELSRFVEGHSHSDEVQGGLADVPDLENMIGRVDSLIQRAKSHRQ